MTPDLAAAVRTIRAGCVVVGSLGAIVGASFAFAACGDGPDSGPGDALEPTAFPAQVGDCLRDITAPNGTLELVDCETPGAMRVVDVVDSSVAGQACPDETDMSTVAGGVPAIVLCLVAQ